jgi:hypothetical protein
MLRKRARLPRGRGRSRGARESGVPKHGRNEGREYLLDPIVPRPSLPPRMPVTAKVPAPPWRVSGADMRLGGRSSVLIARARACYLALAAAKHASLAPGEVAEWLKAPHSKCGIRATVSGVRIPPSPPHRRDDSVSRSLPLGRRALCGRGVIRRRRSSMRRRSAGRSRRRAPTLRNLARRMRRA